MPHVTAKSALNAFDLAAVHTSIRPDAPVIHFAAGDTRSASSSAILNLGPTAVDDEVSAGDIAAVA